MSVHGVNRRGSFCTAKQLSTVDTNGQTTDRKLSRDDPQKTCTMSDENRQVNVQVTASKRSYQGRGLVADRMVKDTSTHVATTYTAQQVLGHVRKLKSIGHNKETVAKKFRRFIYHSSSENTVQRDPRFLSAPLVDHYYDHCQVLDELIAHAPVWNLVRKNNQILFFFEKSQVTIYEQLFGAQVWATRLKSTLAYVRWTVMPHGLPHCITLKDHLEKILEADCFLWYYEPIVDLLEDYLVPGDTAKAHAMLKSRVALHPNQIDALIKDLMEEAQLLERQRGAVIGLVDNYDLFDLGGIHGYRDDEYDYAPGGAA